jgi:hypothetical protein
LVYHFDKGVSTSSRINKPVVDRRPNRKVNTINGLFFSVKDGKMGAFSGARESAAVGGKFFAAAYPPTGTLSLLAGEWTHQLGLKIQTKGVMSLVDLGNGPTAAMIPKDAPGSIEWGVFEIGKGGELTVKDGQNIPTRQWIAYLETDGVYYVGLWDGMLSAPLERHVLTQIVGVTRQPRSFANVTLIATKINAPSKRP